MGLLKSKLMLRLTLAVSVFGVAVGAVSTAAWFQISNSLSPASTIQTDGVRTDAVVYNKNASHSNDDDYNLGILGDEGNTLPYDHSSQSSAVDYYIIGGNGTFSYMNWVEDKALQMYDNPNNTSDLGTYFRLHLEADTEFKIVEGSTDTYYGWNFVSGSSTMIGNFAASTNGGDDKNIKVVTTGTYDIYINYNHEIFLQNHVELTDDTQLGNMVGYYIVGSNTSQTGGVANTGAFIGGNFDFGHSFALQVDDPNFEEGAYYGLHLYVNDIFKIWDGRTRGQGGWYGFDNVISQPTSDGSTNCFVTHGGDDKNIMCQYEGFYDIFISGSVSGNIYSHSITIKFHEEPAPAGLAEVNKQNDNVEKKARRNGLSSGNFIYFDINGNTNWQDAGAIFDVRFDTTSGSYSQYWVQMTQLQSTGIYYAKVPSGTYHRVSITRKSAHSSDWSNVWNSYVPNNNNYSTLSNGSCFISGSSSDFGTMTTGTASTRILAKFTDAFAFADAKNDWAQTSLSVNKTYTMNNGTATVTFTSTNSLKLYSSSQFKIVNTNSNYWMGYAYLTPKNVTYFSQGDRADGAIVDYNVNIVKNCKCTFTITYYFSDSGWSFAITPVDFSPSFYQMKIYKKNYSTNALTLVETLEHEADDSTDLYYPGNPSGLTGYESIEGYSNWAGAWYSNDACTTAISTSGVTGGSSYVSPVVLHTYYTATNLDVTIIYSFLNTSGAYDATATAAAAKANISDSCYADQTYTFRTLGTSGSPTTTIGNYTFYKYSTNKTATGTQYNPAGTVNVGTSAKTFYAVYKPTEYTVTYNEYYNSSNHTSTQKVYAGQTWNVRSISDHSSIGWGAPSQWVGSNGINYNSGATGVSAVTGNVTLTATYTALTQYTVTFKYWKDGAQVGESIVRQYYEGSSTTTPAMPTTPYFGYALPTKWSTSNTGSGGTTYNPNTAISPNSNITLFAVYTTSGTNNTIYFDTRDVKGTWSIGASSHLWVHCWYSNASTGNQTVTKDYECDVINGSSSQYQYIWWEVPINSNVSGMVFYIGDEEESYDFKTSDITSGLSDGTLYKIYNTTLYAADKYDWNIISNNCSGDIRSITIYEKLGDNDPTVINPAYYVLDDEPWDVPSGYISGLASHVTYVKPNRLTTGPTGGGTQYNDGSTISPVSSNISLYAYYASAGFYLYGDVSGVGHWDVENCIKSAYNLDGTTLSFTNVSLSALDEIKIYSASGNGLQPYSTWSGDTTYAVQSTGEYNNIKIRYNGTYTISCTVDGSNNISNIQVVATSLNLNNFTLCGVAASSVSKVDDNFVFTWTNVSVRVGEQIAAESVANDTDVFEAWGYSHQSGFTATQFYSASQSSVDSNVYKIGSVNHRTGVGITLTFGPETNTLTLTTAGSIVPYTCTRNTAKPTSIYLAYGSNNPSTLAEAQNVQRMFYDSDTSGLYYDGDDQKYDKKASYSILTVSTTVKVKVFHGLDVAETAISNLTNARLKNSSGAEIYPATTSVDGVDQEDGYFTLEPGSYVITLIGKDGYSPSVKNSGYAIAVKHVNGARNIANEHEVPVYAVGRGMPGSELANGDYSTSKIKVGNNDPYNRYIPFFAAASQSEIFPCYAKTQDSVIGDSKTTITLKVGDEFVFTDGITTKSTFTLGTNTTAADISTVSSKIVVHKSGTYQISAAQGATDTFADATFTITAVSTITPSAGGNDSTLEAQDQNPVAYSKEHGVRVLNSTGSTINFGGSYDASLLDSGSNYVSFIVELRHINTSRTGTISSAFSGLPNGTKYRYVQTTSTTSNATAIDDGLSFPAGFTTYDSGSPTIFSGVTLGTNTSKINSVDNCFATSTLIEIQIPFASFVSTSDRVTCSILFSISVTFTETISA